MKAGLRTWRSAKRCMKVVMARLVKESKGTCALANDVQENHLRIQRTVHIDEHDWLDRGEDEKRGNAVGLEEMKAERHEQVTCVELQEVVAENDPDAAPDVIGPPTACWYKESGVACLCDDGSEDEDEVSSCKPKRRRL